MPGLRLFTLILALSFPLSLRVAAADATSDGPAIIVFDGSGSMWGTVGTEKPAKLDLVRQALRTSLPSLSPRVRLGLMSFGQRRRADCSDVEVVAPPEAGPPERILSLADKLNPKGARARLRSRCVKPRSRSRPTTAAASLPYTTASTIAGKTCALHLRISPRAIRKRAFISSASGSRLRW
jgi:hypothetical protein